MDIARRTPPPLDCPGQFYVYEFWTVSAEGEPQEESVVLSRGMTVHKQLAPYYFNVRDKAEPILAHCRAADVEFMTYLLISEQDQPDGMGSFRTSTITPDRLAFLACVAAEITDCRLVFVVPEGKEFQNLPAQYGYLSDDGQFHLTN